MKTDKISVDLDSGSTRNLLWSYFKCRNMFPENKVGVFQSLSGVGYHIKINKGVEPLENLKIRALLDDDAFRLRFALKKLALDGAEFVDIAHTTNGKEEVKEIDMDALLEPHKEKVEYVLKNWFTDPEKVTELVNEINDGVHPKLKKLQKKYFITVFAFNTEQLMEKIKKICSDISEKDKSFRYRIYESYLPTSDYFLAITSRTKNQAMQRGMWFIRVKKGKPMVLTEEDLKNIVTFKSNKDKDVYFWIKCKKSK